MKVFIGILYSPNKSLTKLRRCISSIEGQARKPFNFDLKVFVNSPNQSDEHQVKKKLRETGFENPEVIWTKGTGIAARGHNSVLETFLERKGEGYTHLMKIDYDDFYYPFAFEMIQSVLNYGKIDFLNLFHLSDNIIRYSGDIEQLRPTQMFPVEEIVPGVALRSPFEIRINSEELHPFYKHPYYYWNGIDCPGGGITLIKSLHAVELMQSKGYAYLEIPNISDDYTYLVYAILEHLRGNLVFANTDCNEIYCYDMTGDASTTRNDDFSLDTSRWPEEARRVIADPELRPLHGIALQSLPFVSIDETLFDRQMKIDFIRKNLIGA